MSTRRLLAALTTAALLSIAIGGTAVAAKPTKVALCHFNTRTDSWGLISVNEKKVAAHLDHGDGFPGGPVPGGGGATFDDSCGIAGEATAFAIAWVDRNGNHTYEQDTDFLISKLVDANRNLTFDAGDEVITAGYPLDFTSEQFSVFNATTHVVADTFVGAGRIVAFDAQNNVYNWDTPSADAPRELYEERVLDNSLVLFWDGHATTQGDRIVTNSTAPSAPAIERDLYQENNTNDDFVDVFVLASG